MSAIFMQVTRTGSLSDVWIEGAGSAFQLTTTGDVSAGDTLVFTSSVIEFDTFPSNMKVFSGLPSFGVSYGEDDDEVTLSWTPVHGASPDQAEITIPLPEEEEPIVVPDPDNPEHLQSEPEDPEEVIDELIDYSTIRIVSLLPNPVGNDADGELIVIENTGPETTLLADAQLFDARTTYAFPEGVILAPGEQLSLPYSQTRITLNNSGSETISIASPVGLLVDSVSYNDSFEGESYIRTEHGWFWEHELVQPEDPQPDPEHEEEVPVVPQPAEDEEPQDPPESPAPTPGPVNDQEISEDVYLSEFLPDPADDASAEWVELFNDSDSSVNLSGYLLDDIADGGSRPSELENVEIGAQEFFVLHKTDTGIALNNDADDVRLLAPDGTVLDSVSYDHTEKGRSYSQIDSEWVLTNPTPGSENAAPTTQEGVEDEASSTPTEPPATSPSPVQPSVGEEHSPSAAAVSSVDIQAARALPDGSVVKTRGVITAGSGTLLSKGFVLQDTNSGIQVIAKSTDLPDLTPGTEVEVSGEMDTYWSARAVRPSNPSDIRIMGETSVPIAQVRSIGELSGHDLGKLVRTSGFVLSKSSQTVVLEDGGQELRVTFRKRTSLKRPSWENGSRVSVAGVLIQTKDGMRLYPYKSEHVSQDEAVIGSALENSNGVLGTPTALASNGSESFISSDSDLWKRKDVLIGILLGLIASIVAGWTIWKKHGKRLRTLYQHRKSRLHGHV